MQEKNVLVLLYSKIRFRYTHEYVASIPIRCIILQYRLVFARPTPSSHATYSWCDWMRFNGVCVWRRHFINAFSSVYAIRWCSSLKQKRTAAYQLQILIFFLILSH